MDDPIPQSFRPFGPGILTLPERMKREYGDKLLAYFIHKGLETPVAALGDFKRGNRLYATEGGGINRFNTKHKEEGEIPSIIEDFVNRNFENKKPCVVNALKAVGQNIPGDLVEKYFVNKLRCGEAILIPSLKPACEYHFINISGKIYCFVLQFDCAMGVQGPHSNTQFVILGSDHEIKEASEDELMEINKKVQKITTSPCFSLQISEQREPDLLQIINQYYDWLVMDNGLRPISVIAECFELGEENDQLTLKMRDIKIGMYTNEIQITSQLYNDIILQKTPKDIFFEACQRDSYNRRQSLSPFFSRPQPAPTSFWDRFRWSSNNKNNEEDKTAKQSRIDREYGIQSAQRNVPRSVR